jgi:hypothetical protein
MQCCPFKTGTCENNNSFMTMSYQCFEMSSFAALLLGLLLLPLLTLHNVSHDTERTLIALHVGCEHATSEDWHDDLWAS